MKVLSIDPGIKNLSFCLLDENNIYMWKNLCITENKSKDLNSITEKLILLLMDHFDNNLEIDYILIENQPSKATSIIKHISIILFSYFNILRIQYGNIKKVQLISAKNKLKDYYTKNMSYIERKKLSINITNKFINEYYKDYVDFFNSQSKKDDLSDCFLYCMFKLNIKEP